MSDLWQQAQEAVRDGNNEQAHLLLANLLHQERDHVDAWYLLSTIVPSEEQEEVFLRRVLKLRPEHREAQARLAILQGTPQPTAPALPISDRGASFANQAQGDTVPDWLREESGLEAEADEAEAHDIFGDIEQTVAEEIPDWLRDMPQSDWMSDEIMARVPTQSAAEKAVSAVPVDHGRRRATRPSPMLLGLIVAAAIVFLVLIYLIISLGPTLFG